MKANVDVSHRLDELWILKISRLSREIYRSITVKSLRVNTQTVPLTPWTRVSTYTRINSFLFHTSAFTSVSFIPRRLDFKRHFTARTYRDKFGNEGEQIAARNSLTAPNVAPVFISTILCTTQYRNHNLHEKQGTKDNGNVARSSNIHERGFWKCCRGRNQDQSRPNQRASQVPTATLICTVPYSEFTHAARIRDSLYKLINVARL